MHLYDKALYWHQQFVKINGDNVSWNVYVKEIMSRFGDVYEDPLVELKNLKQDGEVKKYQEKFKELWNRVELTKSQAVSFYVGGRGLKHEISMPIKMFNPTTLKEVFCLARMQEATLTLTKTKAAKMVSTGGMDDSMKEAIVEIVKGANESIVSRLDSMHGDMKQLAKEMGSNAAQLESMAVCVYPASLFHIEGVQYEIIKENKEVKEVLASYNDVFSLPKDFPPQRSHDHRIKLMPNTLPINIRPYRYPSNQKDAIEHIVKELLDSGVIRHSQIPFSSHIVMVIKRDGTWRMCVDYRQLNKYTVKDKFPFPIIEELMDELQGATVFSKLDLRSMVITK
nr:reverse transcriptase [Tanacetum cinerariifolium]